MREELETKLRIEYPELYSEMYSECDDGWYDIIYLVLGRIRSQNNKGADIKLIQIKEKFGEIRIYTNTLPVYLEGVMDFATFMSKRTCEVCGNKGEGRSLSGWMKTLCEDHHNEYNNNKI